MAERLSGQDWAREALVVIGEGGLGALAVEPLARRLGATKGSFYWHFANRAALVGAALELWERDYTEGIVQAVEAPGDDGSRPGPADRLRTLLTTVVGYARRGNLEMALLASADDPQVAPVLRRVTERRVGYVAALYEELGLDPADARRNATLAVSVFLGHLQYGRIGLAPVAPAGAAWQDYLELVIARLLPGQE